MEKDLLEMLADIKNGTYVDESLASKWLKMSKELMREQKVREIQFRKLGATKKCAKRMARRAVIAQKNINSSLFRNLKEWDEQLSNIKINSVPIRFVG